MDLVIPLDLRTLLTLFLLATRCGTVSLQACVCIQTLRLCFQAKKPQQIIYPIVCCESCCGSGLQHAAGPLVL